MPAVERRRSSSEWVRERDLLVELIARDIKLRYRGSLLGVLWTLLNPLAELVVLLFVFGRVLQLQVSNFPAYLFTGLIAYGWFQTSATFATVSVVGNRELIRRPGVRPAILPVVTVASNLVHFVLSLPILFGLLVISHVPVTSAVVMLPVLIAIEFVFILGVAYPVSILHVWFRDTQHVLRVALQLLFYLTPVFYDVAIVPDQLRWFYAINPMAHMLDAYRAVLVRGELPAPASVWYLVAVSVTLCASGFIWFRRVSPGFPDEL